MLVLIRRLCDGPCWSCDHTARRRPNGCATLLFMTLPDTSPRFQPFHTAHAIVEMVAAYEFAHNITPAQLITTPEEIGALFGSEFTLQHQQVHDVMATEAGIQFRQLPAFMLQKGQPSRPEWVVRIDPNGFSVHVLNYTRWELVNAEVKSIVDRILTIAAAKPMTLAGIVLRYLDQFNFVGDIKDYDASSLLKVNPHLPQQAFASGPRWHCHNGWFDTVTPEVLHQLNLNSVLPTPGIPGGPTLPAITIEHAQTVRHQPEGALAAYFGVCNASANRDALMQRLHNGNKIVMANLLQSAVAKQINLTVKRADS